MGDDSLVIRCLPTLTGSIARGPLSQAGYEAMKRATKSWRDTLLVMTLRNTGFRPVEVCALEARHLQAQGPVYYLLVHRAKKRKTDIPWEPVFLNPNLGQALAEYARGQRLQPGDRLFGVKERQLRNVVYDAGEAALGYQVQPKQFRRLYIRTVATIAAEVLGFLPQHLQVAQKMVGHESARTTWEWYFELTAEERRAIQERIPV